MSAKNISRPVGRKALVRPAQQLPRPALSPGQTAVARRPVVPTHAAGTTAHARSHMPRNAQS
jgi:hypothetical protein